MRPPPYASLPDWPHAGRPATRPKGPKYHGPKQKHKRTREEERERDTQKREEKTYLPSLISLTPLLIDNHPPPPAPPPPPPRRHRDPSLARPSPAIAAAQRTFPQPPIRFFHGKIAEIPQKIPRNRLRPHFLNKSHGCFRCPAQSPRPPRCRRRRRSHQTKSAPIGPTPASSRSKPSLLSGRPGAGPPPRRTRHEGAIDR